MPDKDKNDDKLNAALQTANENLKIHKGPDDPVVQEKNDHTADSSENKDADDSGA